MEKQNVGIADKPLLMAVKSLTTDFKLQLEDGSWQKIISIEKGFFNNSKLITYKDGRWSCLLDNDKTEALYCH